MNKSIVLGALFAAVFSMGVTPAFAQYMGGGGGGDQDGGHPSMSLEDSLELAAAKVQYAADNPASGSGTPYMDAGGVLGASAIAAAVFGGIAGAFFLRGRSGKYAKPGTG
jgi:hypothetical protein